MRNPAQAYENSSDSTDGTPKAQENKLKICCCASSRICPAQSLAVLFCEHATKLREYQALCGDRVVLSGAEGICCSQV